MDFVKEYVGTLNYDEKTKTKLITSVEKLYKMVETPDGRYKI
jgi:hypothetical protein